MEGKAHVLQQTTQLYLSFQILICVNIPSKLPNIVNVFKANKKIEMIFCHFFSL